MGYRRGQRRFTWSPIVAIVCLVAQLGVMGAGFWHHHHEDGQPESCAVCVAVAAEKTDGLPSQVFVVAAQPLIGLVVEADERAAVIVRRSQGLPRGPPAI